ncbi:MAG TPA: membrane protein insertion efficiency factor YidD [Phycisphaerales bacterium]|nr:membrane protein insertion efficiency factor YidD [Phycisphaerales bacterium]
MTRCARAEQSVKHDVAAATAAAPCEGGLHREPSEARLSPWRWLNLPLLALVFLYRVTLGHFMGGHCRFHPSCSRYAEECFRTLNPVKACRLVAWRIVRCHPWGGGGYDPAPAQGHLTPSAAADRP